MSICRMSFCSQIFPLWWHMMGSPSRLSHPFRLTGLTVPMATPARDGELGARGRALTAG